MLKEEIDKLFDELKQHWGDPAIAFELATRIITESESMSYNAPLPQARLMRADFLRRQGNFDQAAAEFEKAIAISEKLDDRSTLAKSTHGRGIVEYYRENFSGAMKYYEKALPIARKAKDKTSQSLILSSLAALYHDLGMNEIAIHHARNSYDVAVGTQNEYSPAFRLGTLMAATEDFKSAIRWFEIALEIGKHNNDKQVIPACLRELGRMYFQLGDIKKAQEYTIEAAQNTQTSHDYNGEAENNLQLATYNIELGKYEEAKKQLKHAFTLWNNAGRSNAASLCLKSLAKIEIYNKHPQEALRFLSESSDLLPRARRIEELELHKLYAEAYEQLGNWEMVAQHERKRWDINVEIHSERFGAKVKETHLLVAIEKEKKEKEIANMKKDQLERELSTTTLQLLAQTELLAEFREGILAVVRKAPPTEPIAQALREKLKVLPCKSIDWDKFEAQFKAAHPEFTLKLKELYPTLTKMETRLCTLIRMNLKSSDISRLTCISERAVEFHRLNLRKKFGMKKKEDSLPEFLSKL